MIPFTDKIAIVTGGASGIGRALGAALVGHGARVVLADVNADGAKEAADTLGERAAAAHVDVREAAAVQELVDDTVQAHGRLDYLFNNAGIAVIGEVLDMDLADWYRVFDVNLRGVVHGIAAAYPLMVAQGSGHIVNVSSIAGLIPSPHLVAYSATKHAVVGLSLGLRAEAAALGVKVTVVCPGFIDTPIKETSPFLNMDRKTELAKLPFNLYDVDACARDILRGVARNHRMIVVTRHGKVLSRLNKWAPELMERLLLRDMKQARARRTAGKHLAG